MNIAELDEIFLKMKTLLSPPFNRNSLVYHARYCCAHMNYAHIYIIFCTNKIIVYISFCNVYTLPVRTCESPPVVCMVALMDIWLVSSFPLLQKVLI